MIKMENESCGKNKAFPSSMVGATGIEPVTPAVSRQCSTAELRTQ
tara:strand:+ start:5957 stop:6091 length:135 start_codon:yes stop_codon:yes gene_type:complete